MKKDLSMADVETLLILDAIGEGCPHGALAGRLGLCESLAAAVDGAARGLHGLVEEDATGFVLRTAMRPKLGSLRSPAADEQVSHW